MNIWKWCGKTENRSTAKTNRKQKKAPGSLPGFFCAKKWMDWARSAIGIYGEKEKDARPGRLCLCVGRENFIDNGELIYKTEEEPCPTAQKTDGERKSRGNVFKAGKIV